MVVAVFFALVVIVASSVWVTRGLRARGARNRHATGPGTSPDSALRARSYDDIDSTVRTRRCHCGTRLRLSGEGAREEGARRYRIARLACDECEESLVLWFDVTEVLQ